ncbi:MULTISPECIES: LysR substrate-binding domain-containing protein [unclassified Ruegeria]|uniref:LysR substrate-binding domain-containing protein n=1 Tax=unclassified Ruegeria TaxID=2625375 RepID=UPI001ADA7A62|nr:MULTISPECIES: LysR substrate-binding domain-containing protein [unclassified Ruegeria]MBO9412639.1 LysR family transcriptional regulator [Ruegeria sp. R8_1]MBO9416123.1 LysR family transcriptional regulator [Ruegeria sp. R8_2]
MSQILRIRQLEALVAVTTNGSVTAAAVDLGVSQPAVSRLLSDLEKSLGFQLFDRREGRLVPTQEARYLLPSVERVLELMNQISDVSQDITQRKAGHIRVACLPGFATSHLPDVVAGFLKDRPGVTLTIEPDRPERILEWMIGEQYDFGITDSFNGHPAVESNNVDVRTVCVFPTGHELQNLTEITPADLADSKIIHTRRDSDFFLRLSKLFQNANVTLNSHIEVRQFTAACELALKGAGVSVVSELDAVQYTPRGLTFRPFAPALPHTLSLVRPILKQPSLVTLEFIEEFKESLAPFSTQRVDQ